MHYPRYSLFSSFEGKYYFWVPFLINFIKRKLRHSGSKQFPIYNDYRPNLFWGDVTQKTTYRVVIPYFLSDLNFIISRTIHLSYLNLCGSNGGESRETLLHQKTSIYLEWPFKIILPCEKWLVQGEIYK